jgi:hypothetical protein
MKHLNISNFIDRVLELQRIRVLTENYLQSQGENSKLSKDVLEKLSQDFEHMAEAAEFIGADFSSMPARRMAERMKNADPSLVVSDVSNCIADVQSRFRDECSQVAFLVVGPWHQNLFKSANHLVETWDIEGQFPLAARELEEAAKCIALERYTASVFHSMRMVEIAIQRLSEILEVSASGMGAARNWGVTLRTIKEKIDQLYPSSTRTSGSRGEALEAVYASLDAVKNPWRNSTMHVESFYGEQDAVHILRCVCVLLHKLAFFENPIEISQPLDEAELGAETFPKLK